VAAAAAAFEHDNRERTGSMYRLIEGANRGISTRSRASGVRYFRVNRTLWIGCSRGLLGGRSVISRMADCYILSRRTTKTGTIGNKGRVDILLNQRCYPVFTSVNRCIGGDVCPC